MSQMSAVGNGDGCSLLIGTLVWALFECPVVNADVEGNLGCLWIEVGETASCGPRQDRHPSPAATDYGDRCSSCLCY